MVAVFHVTQIFNNKWYDFFKIQNKANRFGSTYEYNCKGIRTKKITSNQTTAFELEGNYSISMNKTTINEEVRLDFVYDASTMLIGINTIEGNYVYRRDILGNIVILLIQMYLRWNNINIMYRLP